jgi:hypothetical protein
MKRWLKNPLISMSIILIVIAALGLTSSYAGSKHHGREPNEVVRPEEIMKIMLHLTGISGFGYLSGIHAGPPGDKNDQAAEYIFRTLNHHHHDGLKVRMETFKMNNPRVQETKMTATVGGSTHDIPIFGCNGTLTNNIVGQVAYVGPGNPSDFIPVNVSGKIALIDSDKFTDTGTTQGTIGSVTRARSNGAIAVIIGENRAPVVRQCSASGGFPTFSVGKHERDYLRNLALSSTPHTVNIMVVARDYSILYDTKYVVAELEGNGSIDEVFMHTSHFSTNFTGAVDNLSNVAENIATAKYFASQPKESRNRNRIFLFSFGHDAGSNEGEEDFALKMQAAGILQKMIVLDIDHLTAGVGYEWDDALQQYVKTGMDSNRQVRATSDLLATIAMFVLDKHKLQPSFTRRSPSSGGGDSNFSSRGTPVIEPGMAHPYYYHTPDDTADKFTVDIFRRHFPALIEVSEMVDSLPEGYIFHADRNVNRLPFYPNTPPEVEMYVFPDKPIHVGDLLIVSLDEQKWFDDKTCYLAPVQLPMYAFLNFSWGDGTPDANNVSTWTANHRYASPGTYTLTLTLTDSQNAKGTATRIITVLP